MEEMTDEQKPDGWCPFHEQYGFAPGYFTTDKENEEHILEAIPYDDFKLVPVRLMRMDEPPYSGSVIAGHAFENHRVELQEALASMRPDRPKISRREIEEALFKARTKFVAEWKRTLEYDRPWHEAIEWLAAKLGVEVVG